MNKNNCFQLIMLSSCSVIQMLFWLTIAQQHIITTTTTTTTTKMPLETNSQLLLPVTTLSRIRQWSDGLHNQHDEKPVLKRKHQQHSLFTDVS